MKKDQKKRMRTGLKKLHNQVTALVNNYYRHNSHLPTFDCLDTMWITVSDKIDDAEIRGRLRGIRCTGFMRGPDDYIGVILGIPDNLQSHLGMDDELL